MTSRRDFLSGVAPAEVLSQLEAEAIAKKVLSYAKAPQTVVRISSTHARNTRFGRSDITTARDRFGGEVRITSTIGPRVGQVLTQRFDDDGLKVAVAEAEDAASQGPERPTTPAIKAREFPTPPGLSFDSTDQTTLEQRATLVGSAIDRAKNYTSAGTLDVDSESNLVMNSAGLVAFSRESHTRLTMTARSQDNTGSGWAGNEMYDVSKLRPADIAARAVDKCERSRNPQGVEPGRYTTVLEPAAYADMIYMMMMFQMGLDLAERGVTAFSKQGGGSKIGLKVMDERLSFVSDPMDPDGPFRPFTDDAVPYERTPWIEDGILRHLSFGFEHAHKVGREFGIANPISVRLTPRADVPLMTLDEMVSTCERGIYITRVSAQFSFFRLMLFTGVTRDGTWLIEKGKITRPIKNLRYLDSHLFFLNNLEATGKPELVAQPLAPLGQAKLVLPPVRVRDFNFTALADAL